MWSSAGTEKKGYPPEAIWEVFVNAIVHRDYSISDDVHVTIFNDRIEIASPGKLPGYVRVDNILDARFSRNSRGCYGLASLNGFKGLDGNYPQALSV
jgi:ATP-dependent DNA helicase RecG